MASGILSPTHLLVVLVVALIVLGPKRLPGAGKALGQGLREFKDSIGGSSSHDEPAHIAAASLQPAAEDIPMTPAAPESSARAATRAAEAA